MYGLSGGILADVLAHCIAALLRPLPPYPTLHRFQDLDDCSEDISLRHQLCGLHGTPLPPPLPLTDSRTWMTAVRTSA